MSNKPYISPLWIVTLLSLIAGGYLSWQWYIKQGSEITISFTDASGLVPDQSGVYYNGAKIGKITDISLTKENEILVTARMQQMAEPLLKDGAKFWISRPELDLQGIRNLSAIASGAKVEIKAGSGSPKQHFIGRNNAPLESNLASGLRIVLEAEKLGSVSIGSPVTFRDMKTGEVTNINLSENADSLLITARIYHKYANLIQDNTAFWNAGGLHTDIHALGTSYINIPSLASLFTGKISFANESKSNPAKDGQIFTLLATEPGNHKNWKPELPWQQENSK
ncbi:MlaD family protein [Rickettsiales bacterium]|nr:MlaD family protein [Rickettsiales bacterium]